MSLKGRTALVTGSTSGIGQGIAEALAAAGADVVLNGFGRREEIERLREEMAQAHGVRVHYNAADLTDGAQIDRMIAEAQALFGGLDILVNNAGIQHVSPIESFPLDVWDRVIAINLTSSFRAIRQALPGMRERGWGRIVNVASAHGLSASPQKAAYVAAKHGVVGLTKVVALETATDPITCNAICPGWVLTPLVEQQIRDRAREAGLSYEEMKVKLVADRTPSREYATPEQIGGLTVFLCGPAAEQITGAALSIDGGWMAQ